ncbi:heavy metal-binding domain-containing protein [Halomonas rhizosphaerae]|uniref:Heavy metal-binding domain-containing protein n=1 Tax=Halomonas rhizosphaerae TaxID=3043296 RepID=A0ABT6UV38_9GAMM|nr:heavy metal-binding domain-containing protein [Halomonas rhizosphaerae]MDI5889556.1 heavy metal-binding domain-containing protein [Halomonas rhizosphaerae]
MTIAGARKGRPSIVQRLVGRAQARNLSCLIVPGPEVALAHGLDLAAAGMRIAATPRDAAVLVVIGALSRKLDEATAVLYAQMPRPRAVLVLGGPTPSSLPPADVSTDLSQAELIEATGRLQQALAEGAFTASPEDFDASVLQARIEYVCPMHPEVVEDEPGRCPKCGMDLVAREAGAESGATEGMSEHDHNHHHEHHQGHDHNHHDHDHDDGHQQGHAHEHARTEYVCPMHPQVVQDEPGSCPKCGMDLVARVVGADEGAAEMPLKHGDHHDHEHHEHERHQGHDHEHHHEHGQHKHDHGGHDHSGHDHGASGFMSMVEVTKDLPRSADGLAMDWIKVPFGPVFPGLPGGLRLTLTLDGDGVAEGQATSLVGMSAVTEEGAAETFVERLATAMALAPVSYRLLACRAIEQAAGLKEDPATARARACALERERIASHLGWLAQLGRQLSFVWLMRRATTLQLKTRCANREQLVAMRPALWALNVRLELTPLLKARLKGIGALPGGSHDFRGPVARAAGSAEDVRQADTIYRELGFEIRTGTTGGDAWGRLQQRLMEIMASLDLIEAGVDPGMPTLRDIGSTSGISEASVETPRGRAALRLTLEHGQVVSVELDTACSHHIGLVANLVEGRELGDALVAVGSLDLSPWEVIS